MAKIIGAAIQKARKKRRMTQVKLAGLTETTQAHISNIEKGKVHPSPDMLQRISSVLEVPVPVLQFLSLQADDIPEERRRLFLELSAPLGHFMKETFDL